MSANRVSKLGAERGVDEMVLKASHHSYPRMLRENITYSGEYYFYSSERAFTPSALAQPRQAIGNLFLASYLCFLNAHVSASGSSFRSNFVQRRLTFLPYRENGIMSLDRSRFVLMPLVDKPRHNTVRRLPILAGARYSGPGSSGIAVPQE